MHDSIKDTTSYKSAALYKLSVAILVAGLILTPALASAQQAPNTAFSGITDYLKSIAQLIIYDWGTYIGIITLGIQGYRWKMGRIDAVQLLYWGLGIAMLFFAPQIVLDLKSRSGGTVQ